MLWLNVKLHMVTMIVEWLMQKLCESDRDLQGTGFFLCLFRSKEQRERERERERERDLIRDLLRDFLTVFRTNN